jgi:hypothetical protein
VVHQLPQRHPRRHHHGPLWAAETARSGEILLAELREDRIQDAGSPLESALGVIDAGHLGLGRNARVRVARQGSDPHVGRNGTMVAEPTIAGPSLSTHPVREARRRSGQAVQLRRGVHEVRRREPFRVLAVDIRQRVAGLVTAALSLPEAGYRLRRRASEEKGAMITSKRCATKIPHVAPITAPPTYQMSAGSGTWVVQ